MSVNKNLKYFMRSSAKEEEIFTVDGPDSIKDENGNPVQLKIKKLRNKTIADINDMYKSRTLLKDRKGNYIVQNGEAVYSVDKDSARAMRHIIVEALVEPNLKDPDLMKFFDCVDVTDMPYHVFFDNAEFAYVSRKIMEVLGMVEEDNSTEKEVEEAKN